LAFGLEPGKRQGFPSLPLGAAISPGGKSVVPKPDCADNGREEMRENIPFPAQLNGDFSKSH